MSRRVVTEILVVSLFDERRGGPLDGVGERESAPCDALGEKEAAQGFALRAHVHCSVLLSVSVRICSRWDFCGDALQCY